LPEGAQGQLERLLEALAAEPDPHTTVSELDAAAEIHVADSLSGLEVSELRQARRIADLGAGAGFPGLVLAVAIPSAEVDLIESAGRRAAVGDRLLQAAQVTNARTVKARAVVVEYAAPLLKEGGVLVAWRGARDAEAEAAATAAAELLGMAVGEVKRVVPFPGAERRHLHVFEKTGPTPDRFPRRPGMAKKRPLG
jgi:16S rRNA (guanine527-N7)-methyltransferase